MYYSFRVKVILNILQMFPFTSLANSKLVKTIPLTAMSKKFKQNVTHLF